ncbi:MATE family efflux transporter [Sporofaciens musculi]|jgi:putative MATE family efflux protein|uniref:MATE family efflux transporter n=1 Tax=Sporofaciens musculi TaxID=2681861 RepID=UPI002570937E|nr:MATE family efflux transporter [Sporofaciens musculi]
MNLEQLKQDTTKMIWQFSIPAIISMVLTSLITIADGFFIGNYVGKEGIAAVNLGLPIIYLYLGVGLMVSIGGVAIAGMALGSGDESACSQVFRQTIVTTFIFSVLLSFIMVFSFQPMLSLLRADRCVIEYFQEYYRIMLLELPVMVVNSSFGMFIRGEGYPKYYMKISIMDVLFNIFLDYVFTDWLHMGVAGIALASLLAALASFICILYFFVRKASIYRLGGFRFSGKICVQSILNGSSEFIGEMSTGIAMFAYNFVIMRKIGADGVTAFTIVGYVAYAFSMVIVGFGQGTSPLISFAYGAKEKILAAHIRRRTNRYVCCAGIVVFLLMAAGMEWYSRLFVQNERVEGMIQSGMLIFMTSFFFSGVNAITSFYYTATGRAFESAVISASRGLVVLLACIFTLPFLFGMTGVWLAAPVTEGITLGITLYFLRSRQ